MQVEEVYGQGQEEDRPIGRIDAQEARAQERPCALRSPGVGTVAPDHHEAAQGEEEVDTAVPEEQHTRPVRVRRQDRQPRHEALQERRILPAVPGEVKEDDQGRGDAAEDLQNVELTGQRRRDVRLGWQRIRRWKGSHDASRIPRKVVEVGTVVSEGCAGG